MSSAALEMVRPASRLGAFTTALSASSVSRQYSRRLWGLREATVSIPAGLITGLVGPNGAGKSTLMRLFVGFDRPTSGSVSVLGYDPWRQRAEAMCKVGYVPQAPAVYREMSVHDHLRLARHYRKDFSMELARRRLDQLGIGLSTSAGRLSGGQLAQLSLTIAVATNAEVLLLDEPAANLDPLARAEFLSQLAGGGQRHVTTVLSSHIVEDIATICEYLIVLGGGQVLLEGMIPSLLERHVLAPSEPSPEARFIATVVTGGGEPRRLWEVPDAVATGPAALGDVVLGYLTVGREMGDRTR